MLQGALDTKVWSWFAGTLNGREALADLALRERRELLRILIEEIRVGMAVRLSSRPFDIEIEILMHLRSTKRIRKEVNLFDPIGSDREGNEINLMDILSSERDDVVDSVVLNIDRARLADKLNCLSKGSVLSWNCGLGLGKRKGRPKGRSGASWGSRALMFLALKRKPWANC